MTTPRFLDELGAKLDGVAAKISELAANSPARDIEKNVKAMLAGAFSHLELVPREDFEVQRELLAKANERLAALEVRVEALEKEDN
ncbi:MAG: accessory factor UbiK family protein [Azoarcus sp.]|jgi:BMFP domain-containing protein YqiC|nr:accessory factor UbiK family protein [Azoarcus sp.]